jgi:peptide deformylase
MSEFLTIDTEKVAKPNTWEDIIPLPIYGDDYEMLSRVMPEYQESLPNQGMYRLVNRLKATMKKYSGLGLSANQCGVEARVFVIGTDEFQIACINPKIVKFHEEHCKMKEGCLSYPGLFLLVDRHKSVDVEYLDENGVLHKKTLDGVTAQCFQHELDHLNGIKIEDHVGPLSLKMAKKRRDKVLKKVMKKGKL